VVSKHRSLHVYILNWDFAMVYALERELFPIIKFNRTNHRRIHFKLDGQHPVGASHHRKIVVVDDKLAYVGGIDLTRMRWDTPEHLPNDPRRVDPLGRAYRPFHDVQMAVDGEAAERLGQMFRDRWEVVTGESLAPPEKGERDPWPTFLRPDVEDVPVAIARTEPGDGMSSPVREVEALCLDGIAAARSHIYIETQFLTSSSIERALAARLEERDCPEILIVLPLRPSNWLENSTLGILQKRLIERLRMGDEFKRLRFVYPVVPGLGEGEYLNLHSKVMVVDDALALVGSSNFTNRSMGVDSECDLAIEAHGSPRIGEVVARFRNRLLGEHMGASPEQVSEVMAREGSLFSALEKLGVRERRLEPLPLLDHEWWMDGLISDHSAIDPEEPVDPENLIDELIPEEEKNGEKSNLIRFGLLLFFMIALAAAWRWTPLGDQLRIGAFRGVTEYLHGNPAAILFVVVGFSIGSVLMIPVTFLIFLTAFIFGPFLGALYALLGCTASAILTYGLGRLLGREKTGRLAGSRIRNLSRRLAHHGMITMTVVRLLPIAPFTVVNMVAGATRVRLNDFTVGTILGMIPGIVAIAVFQRQLINFFQKPSLGRIGALVAVSASIVGAGLAIRWWIKKGKKRKGIGSWRSDGKDARMET
jgi:phospholipase D1/2